LTPWQIIVRDVDSGGKFTVSLVETSGKVAVGVTAISVNLWKGVNISVIDTGGKISASCKFATNGLMCTRRIFTKR
jgi:hypothetical protein